VYDLHPRGRCTCGLLIGGASRRSALGRTSSRRRWPAPAPCTPWRRSESSCQPWWLSVGAEKPVVRVGVVGGVITSSPVSVCRLVEGSCVDECESAQTRSRVEEEVSCVKEGERKREKRRDGETRGGQGGSNSSRKQVGGSRRGGGRLLDCVSVPYKYPYLTSGGGYKGRLQCKGISRVRMG
jgi:hypothetical protein